MLCAPDVNIDVSDGSDFDKKMGTYQSKKKRDLNFKRDMEEFLANENKAVENIFKSLKPTTPKKSKVVEDMEAELFCKSLQSAWAE